jgi:hypothetical protein
MHWQAACIAISEPARRFIVMNYQAANISGKLQINYRKIAGRVDVY